MKISAHLKLPALVLLALCAGCGTSQQREGLILFHDPAPKTRTGKTLPPQTFIFTSDRDAGASSLEVSSGIRGKPRAYTNKDRNKNTSWRQRTLGKFKLSNSVPITNLTRDTFGNMIDQLENAGLFRLPNQPGDKPPKNRAFFLVSYKNGESAVYPKPDKALLDRRFSPQEARALYPAWHDVKIVMVQFVSSN